MILKSVGNKHYEQILKLRHRMNTDPYKPTLSESSRPLKSIHWLRRFAILNGVLFLVPVVCPLAAYLVLEANGISISGVSGAMGMELAVLLIAYLAIPNSIMFAFCLRSRRSSRQQNGGK
jgi:hypothetical protein